MAYPILWGDLNKDGEITVTDLTILKRYLAGIQEPGELYIYADVNRDGYLNADDLVLMKMHLLGMDVIDQTPLPFSGAVGEAVTGIKEVLVTAVEPIKIKSAINTVGIVIGLIAVMFFLWFGLRYAVRKIKASFKKGRISS